MNLIDPRVADHLAALVPQRAPLLQAMERRAGETGFPIIGPVAGHFCYLVARLTNARRVFELGSGFGYSTAWFARAVHENGDGEVHHAVRDAALSAEARVHLDALGFAALMHYHIGEAVAALRNAGGSFDLVFNDIDKPEYPASLSVIHERLRPGGVLIVDNALWHGRIFDAGDDSEATAGVRELTRLLSDENRWLTTLVPIRDGLLLAVKRG